VTSIRIYQFLDTEMIIGFSRSSVSAVNYRNCWLDFPGLSCIVGLCLRQISVHVDQWGSNWVYLLETLAG
jgi:hypothetical protein